MIWLVDCYTLLLVIAVVDFVVFTDVVVDDYGDVVGGLIVVVRCPVSQPLRYVVGVW